MAITSADVFVHRRRPRYETALERDRVEPGEDDAQLVVRGRAVGEASKAPVRNESLARPKRAMSATVSAPASIAASIKSSTSSSG